MLKDTTIIVINDIINSLPFIEIFANIIISPRLIYAHMIPIVKLN